MWSTVHTKTFANEQMQMIFDTYFSSTSENSCKNAANGAIISIISI